MLPSIRNYFWYDHTLRSTVIGSMNNYTEDLRMALTASLRCQSVERVVALTHRADRAAERKGGRGRQCPAVSVNVADTDLY